MNERRVGDKEQFRINPRNSHAISIAGPTAPPCLHVNCPTNERHTAYLGTRIAHNTIHLSSVHTGSARGSSPLCQLSAKFHKQDINTAEIINIIIIIPWNTLSVHADDSCWSVAQGLKDNSASSISSFGGEIEREEIRATKKEIWKMFPPRDY